MTQTEQLHQLTEVNKAQGMDTTEAAEWAVLQLRSNRAADKYYNASH